VLAGYLIGFVDGTAAHVRALAAGGIHAYVGFSQVLFQVFFVGLVVLDPLVVVLVGFVLRAGVWLAGGVMVLDVAANWIGNWVYLRDGLTHRLPGLLGLALFGLFVLVSAPALLRVMPRWPPLRGPAVGGPP
jgi:hypothetical protein